MSEKSTTADPGGAGPEEESVVVASFTSRRAAERMLASLGRGFRRKARNGGATALVVSGNKDGSLTLTQSRVLTASGLAAALMRVSFSWMVGLMGMFSTLKGTRAGAYAVHERESHVGSGEHPAHKILNEAGPKSAIALIRIKDREMGQMVAARAAEWGSYSWDGSYAEFLGALDAGSQHDWVRQALDEPASTHE
jgi:hypothetical protein